MSICLAALGFLQMSFTDILDIMMVATIIFFVFRWIRGSSAMSIFMAVLLLYIIKVIVSSLNMTLMSGILGTVIDVGVIALIVIFQPEIRYFLTRLGSRYAIGGNLRQLLDKILGRNGGGIADESISELLEAVKVMADQKTGALIVISRQDALQHIIATGDTIDAKINKRLLLNLFFKNSPLHDGAVVLEGSRIVAARCTLPLTGQSDIPAHYGMRHKAAIGITEESDAKVIVVSEETGNVSFVSAGQIQTIANIDQLKGLLSEENKGE